MTSGDSRLDPRQDELEPVPLLDLLDELLDGEGSGDGSEKVLDGSLVTIDVEQSSDDLRSSSRVDSLNVGLDGGGETVLVEEEDEVVDEVESIADDNEGELIGKLGLWEVEGEGGEGKVSTSLVASSLSRTNEESEDSPLRKFLTFSGL